ncbi:aminodeoxychorismate synthase component I [Aliarcobacter butzleri]|uniref:aminodeoxychorismate synthase component I n=1 Tax=Aliarcobacter butzleri TaxID=28197 RepID=UPI00065851C0|nr:aminodeoxychorismate synthase component I [Aliarcobacter butzleri]KLE06609.1 para-aminobenzoate synthase [Aliarcobacter butzleri L353]MCG3712099.1 aminodeoxychorismate synthase component I [Aliarcobacter butzleri]
MNKKIIEEQINKFGFEKEPFLFLISYDFKKFYIEKLSNLSNQIKYEINQKETKSNKRVDLEKFPITFEEYKKKFDILQEEIKEGNSYLLNLTAKTKIKTALIKTALNLEEIYKNTKSMFKLKVHTKDDNFVCFSPEKFVEIKNSKILTYPMKGTIDANIKDAKIKILENQKELAEHTMVVDLLRNDLGIIGSNVKVEDFRYVDIINAGNKELLQVSSKISATLQSNWLETLGTIIISLLPAGSITGTPKKKTVEILENVENYEREFYTGIFGIFDGNSFDSYVLIRFIEEKNGELFYKSGGGITCDSDAFLEYEELLDKIYLPF